ncbi:MAG: phosphatidate cytidylyltransferase [bacterium]
MKNDNKSHKHPLLKRLATAFVGIPLLIVLIFYGTPFHFWLVITACILLGIREFYQILGHANIRCFTPVGLGLGALVSIAFREGCSLERLFLVITLTVMVPFIGYIFHFDDLSTVIPELCGTMSGVFFIAWMLGHLIWIRGLDHGEALIFYLLLVVWIGDSSAFFTGTYLGRHRLSPLISPKKTIEGSVGAIAGSILVSVIAHFTFLPSISLGNSIILGMLLNILGQLGDLSESLLKRGAGVKDSGTLFPGHGGILDRIDSLIFAGPALYYYLTVFQRNLP